MFENLCRFHEIFQKLDMQIRVSGWCEYALVCRDWLFFTFLFFGASSVWLWLVLFTFLFYGASSVFPHEPSRNIVTADRFQVWFVIMYKSNWHWIVWVRTRTFFRDMNIKEEHPSSKEKRERRKDDMKGRKKDKPNNLVQVQLFKKSSSS